MHYAFQDYENLYLVLDLLTGGDLRYQIGHHTRKYFSEKQTKFFISCIIESLTYIHKQGIIHRDIKPENLVFDNNGYLHTTDFGISKILKKNNKHETSGTPGYMAPEVMNGQKHNGSVDFFAVGIILYELMNGKRPYVGKNRKEIKEQMMSYQVFIKKEFIPDNWSEEAADFVNRLLVRKDVYRLGYYNELEIKKHPWFKDVNFEELVNKNVQAPFLPQNFHDNYDKNYCEEIEVIGVDTMSRYEFYKRNENIEELFYGFTYCSDEKEYFNSLVKINRNKFFKDTFKSRINQKLKKYMTIDVGDKNLNNIYNNDYVGNKKNLSINAEGSFNRNKIKLLSKKNINLNPNFLYLLHKNKLINEQKKQKVNENQTNQFINNNIIGKNLINNYNPSLCKKQLYSDITKNIINSYHLKQKESEKTKDSNQKHVTHLHAGSFNNNFYINILKQLDLTSINNSKNSDFKTLNQKDEKNSNINISSFLNNFNNGRNINVKNIDNTNKTNTKFRDIIYAPENKTFNYNNRNKVKKELSMFYSIENKSLSIMNENNNQNLNKIAFDKNSTNFYPRKNSQKILAKTKENFDNFNTIKIGDNDDEPIINHSRRFFINKIKRKNNSGILKINNSFGKIKIKKELSSSKSKNKISSKNSSIKLKTGLFIGRKKTFNYEVIKHNHSFSTVNNIVMYKKSFVKSNKIKKNNIPIKLKNSLNSISNSKISSIAHKKIPFPSLKITTKNSFSDFYQNNTINNLMNKTTKNSLYCSKLSNNSNNSKDKYSTIGANKNVHNLKKYTTLLKKLGNFPNLTKNSFKNLNKIKIHFRKNSKSNFLKEDKNVIEEKKLLKNKTKKIFVRRMNNNNINNQTSSTNKRYKNSFGTFSSHSFNTTCSSNCKVNK